MEELNKIPGETVKSALKELCIKTGMDDEMFNAFENPEDCFKYLEEFYTPGEIVSYVNEYHKKKAGLRSKRRRRSKRKGSKKKRSKKSKRRSRKYIQKGGDTLYYFSPGQGWVNGSITYNGDGSITVYGKKIKCGEYYEWGSAWAFMQPDGKIVYIKPSNPSNMTDLLTNWGC